MVEQFGLAMILSSRVSTSALISGTTSFLVGSIRQAEELSTTVVPTSANLGAHSSEVPPPAEKMAMSGRAATASAMPITLYVRPLYVISLPTDFSEATGRSSVKGKLRSSSTWSILEPTKPVAPTTATFIFFSVNLCFFRYCYKVQIYAAKTLLLPQNTRMFVIFLTERMRISHFIFFSFNQRMYALRLRLCWALPAANSW